MTLISSTIKSANAVNQEAVMGLIMKNRNHEIEISVKGYGDPV